MADGSEFLSGIERQIAAWHGISPPNAAARILAAGLEAGLEAQDRLRGPSRLEAPIGDFAESLALCAEPERPTRALDGDPCAEAGLAGLRDGLRAGRVSATAALAEAEARVGAYGARFNAVLWTDFARAGAAAAAADGVWADAAQTGRRLAPLHGVPLAHKDLFGWVGEPQSCGSDFWAEHRAGQTARVREALAAAGAISFGGLHMADFAQNPTGQNARFGDCLNPWDTARITGGSSSGSGVAVSVGITTGSLGSDTGGSIRLPAACCGVTGLKPTYGRVSRAGVVPLCASLDCVGPLARTARDCAILLDVIAGPDRRDPSASAVPVAAYEAGVGADLVGMRLGVTGLETTAPEIAAAIRAALAGFAALGVGARMVSLPHWDAIVAYGSVMARAEAAALHAPFMRAAPERFVPHVAARLYPGYAIPATHYIEAVQARPFLLAAFCRDLFATVDVLALPTLPGRVPTRAETDMDSGRAEAAAAFFAVGDQVRPFNYLGLPALSLPVGQDQNGMPIGLQLVGRPFAEARLLALAAQYQARRGLPPRPGFAA